MDEIASLLLNRSSFGCCHRYRECSDEKRCLLQDEDNQRSELCAYRINLECGNIFYGKNANGFSMVEYNDYQERYDATSGELRKALDDIILYLVGGSYLSSSVIWFYSNEIEHLQKLGFITYSRNHRLTLEKYLMKDLKSASGSTLRKKIDVISYIIDSDNNALTLLSEPYCYLQIPKHLRQYAEELFYDRFRSTSNNRYLGPIPFSNKKIDDGDK